MLKKTLRKILFGESNLNIGDVVKLILPPSDGGKADKGALAICVDGEKEFPTLYKQLISKVGELGALEFVWVKWIKTMPEYYNQIDGAYAKYRFVKFSVEESKIN